MPSRRFSAGLSEVVSEVAPEAEAEVEPEAEADAAWGWVSGTGVLSRQGGGTLPVTQFAGRKNRRTAPLRYSIGTSMMLSHVNVAPTSLVSLFR